MIKSIIHAASFAAGKHRNQRRKNAEQSPYINHPLAVADVLVREGEVTDQVLIVAALLHDTVEDTETTADELETLFGTDVLKLVLEVTDDKSLEKSERKRLQVERAPKKSSLAKQLKLADKICNLRDIDSNTPSSWSSERKEAYLDWAQQVCAGCVGANPLLDGLFAKEVKQARGRLEIED